ncbi:probable deoxyhypusine synthase [Agrilus planipennis]|uniref:deoxyhypusine synthase n=1 Tax=Agrilus planipennis TaxID=224129 RepID=A0A1W4WRB5_AGRPL|nr:probable deoxyhypusine synthase [Agrilus planipennis]
MSNKVPEIAKTSVLVKSCDFTDLKTIVKGYDEWEKGVDYRSILKSYINCGFQSTNLGLAIEEINKMIQCRKEPLPSDTCINEEDPFIAITNNCTLFLGYTSNIVSSGLRETLKFLIKNKMIDCLVTTAGGIEEDFIKCLAPTFIGDFNLDGVMLREKGINRIGNLLVPNNNYCKFEDWVLPILDEMVKEQMENRIVWSPSTIIAKLGEKINNEESIYYWAAKNKIPVFCPALTDGSLGDMIFFHSFKNPGLIIDIISDLKRLNMMAINAKHTGMIIIGGGVVKHHICNANLMRNGADYSVFINTASEFDGSDAGARPDEAKSWGKIKKEASPVKIYAEATLVFPLIVGETFAKDFHENNNNQKLQV